MSALYFRYGSDRVEWPLRANVADSAARHAPNRPLLHPGDSHLHRSTCTPVTPPRVGTIRTGSKPMSGRCRWGSRWRAALLAAVMAAGVVALGPPTTQAGATAGTVGEVRLSSDAAGELTISWDPPASTPSDYRVMWAEASQDYLSWKADNEATRGNSYPEGSAASLTLTGLTEGVEYKVRVRSRYRSGGPHGPWSGPWTDESHPASAQRHPRSGPGPRQARRPAARRPRRAAAGPAHNRQHA